MRICFVSRRCFPTISGMSVYALNLLRQLRAQGHDLTMVGQFYGGARACVYGSGPPEPIDGVRVIGAESVGEQERGDFETDVRALSAQLVALHEEEPFDLFHAQYAYPTGLAALDAARQVGVPCIVSIQGGDGHWVGSCCGTHARAMRRVLDGADALLIGSESFAEEVRDRLGTPTERFTIVPGAVDVERFTPRDERHLGEGATTILYHGRVDARKGVFELLQAFEALRDEGRAVRLVVSGIGPEHEAVKKRAALSPFAGDICVSGYADYDAAPRVYHRADVFASPTYAEGFSNTILEAMASGLPIVSTRAVGIIDCLRHGENGLLANVADAADLRAQLARVLDDAALRRALARTALAETREVYSWSAIARQIAGEYRRVLAAPRASGEWSLPDEVPEPCRFRAEPHLL